MAFSRCFTQQSIFDQTMALGKSLKSRQKPAPAPNGGGPLIEVRGVKVGFGDVTVLEALSLDVRRGEILGFVGASGSGKSVLLRAILGLTPKQAGTIRVLGKDLSDVSASDKIDVDMRMGVLFQHGALFSALTVLENVMVPMREYLDLSPRLMAELARFKLSLVGLNQESAELFPSQLSGGMIKRAGLARALALDPDIVFLDEPTSGLDPIGAANFDELIVNLRDTLGLTVYMVTHDLDSLLTACDRIAVLGNKRILLQGTVNDMLSSEDEWIKSYFRGKRARMIALKATS
jgi:phospholipid/cholesterol/gamma-HCH transport system ATP-binding protein